MVRSMLFSFELWAIILCIIAGICVYLTPSKDIKGTRMVMALVGTEILLCLTEIILYGIEGNTAAWTAHLIRAMGFILFIFNLVNILISMFFIAYSIKKHGGKLPRVGSTIICLICFLNFVFVVISMFTEFFFILNERNGFRRGPHFAIYYILNILCFVIMFTEVMVARKKLEGKPLIALSEMAVFPVAGTIIECFGQKLFFIHIGTVISILLLIALYESNYAEKLIEKEKKIRDEQLKIFNHQIQPHFIFNTLTAIRSLCDEDSKAIKGIDSFSSYLRGCVDMLTKTDCVSVEKELSVVDSFLEIIQMRFRDKVKTIRNIEEIEFLVPPFAIQSIVENSFYHGIRNREDRSGTIWISIFPEKDHNIVEIKDDGVGFDVKSVLDEENEEHGIALVNTIRRVEAMCGGSVEIVSEPGKGTDVKLIFPVKR